MPILKPRRLPRNAHLAILSPASIPSPEKVFAGIAALQALGYRTTLYPSALKAGPLNYAGTMHERLADLHAAFADPSIDAILCTRGGWGTAELLPHLDLDLIRANPKPYLGYSDHTSIQAYLQQQLGLVAFYAPMCAADFSRPEGPDLSSWTHALTGSPSWTLGPAEGLRLLKPGPIATGQFLGGCLSIYLEALATPYAPAVPSRPTILFFEDIGAHPYQWDRHLLHLQYAGHLDTAQAIILGDMSQNVAPEDYDLLDRTILHRLYAFPGPIAIGLRSGHVDTANVTLPLGIQATLNSSDPTNPCLTFLEPSVL